MEMVKKTVYGLFGFMITVLLGLSAWIGERQIGKLDTIVYQQQQHLVEFAVVNNEVAHIKNNIEKIDRKVQSLDDRSKLYWPEWEHIAEEKKKGRK